MCLLNIYKAPGFLWRDAHLVSCFELLKGKIAIHILGYFWCLRVSTPPTPVCLSVPSVYLCLLQDQHTVWPERLCFPLSFTGISLWPLGSHHFLFNTMSTYGPSWQRLKPRHDRLIYQYIKNNLSFLVP